MCAVDEVQRLTMHDSLRSSFWKWWMEKLLEIWVWWGLGASDFGSSARQRSHIWSGHGREENHTRHSSRLHGSSAPNTWLWSWKNARLRKASELAHFSIWHTKRHYYWFQRPNREAKAEQQVEKIKQNDVQDFEKLVSPTPLVRRRAELGGWGWWVQKGWGALVVQ